ncbi:hypothetical protein LZ30DRAFT_719189 [Colletotrichum cereale]|nr:hypothetical protein LZ30DRAFT_719189 [Colletotrichum cereale]
MRLPLHLIFLSASCSAALISHSYPQHVNNIRRANTDSGDYIPADDNDIEPMWTVDGIEYPYALPSQGDAFVYIKNRFPNLQDGWYYGMLCTFDNYDPDDYFSISEITRWTARETGGCSHVGVLIGKYNTTRMTFVSHMFDVVSNESQRGWQWKLRQPDWKPNFEKQEIRWLKPTSRERARSPRVRAWAENWVKENGNDWTYKANCLTFFRELVQLLKW